MTYEAAEIVVATVICVAVCHSLVSFRLSTLHQAVETAGLTEILSSPGQYTMLAPTNQAFRYISRKHLAKLMKNPPKLRQVLLAFYIPYTSAGSISPNSWKTLPNYDRYCWHFIYHIHQQEASRQTHEKPSQITTGIAGILYTIYISRKHLAKLMKNPPKLRQVLLAFYIPYTSAGSISPNSWKTLPNYDRYCWHFIYHIHQQEASRQTHEKTLPNYDRYCWHLLYHINNQQRWHNVVKWLEVKNHLLSKSNSITRVIFIVRFPTHVITKSYVLLAIS